MRFLSLDPRDRYVSPITFDVGATKYGPVPNANSTGHQIQFLLHASSEICSCCGEFENGTGLKVLGTFTEWKSSDSAKAGRRAGAATAVATMEVVDPRVKRNPHRRQFAPDARWTFQGSTVESA